MKRMLSIILAIGAVFSLGDCGARTPTWQEQYALSVRY